MFLSILKSRFAFILIINQKAIKHFKSIITLVILTIIFTSCSTDDEINDVNTTLIVGEWEITSLENNTTLDLTVEGQTATSTSYGTGSNFNYTITFNDDSSLIANGSYDYTVTSSTNGSEITQTTSFEDINTTGNWSVNGDQMSFTGFITFQTDNQIISDDINPGTSTITVLNETTLVLTTDLGNSEISGFPEGVDYNFEGESIVILTRVN